MNYWILTTEYPPLYGGGIGTYCYHTARMLAEKGHSVTVFIPDDTLPDQTADHRASIRIIRFNSNRSGMGKHLGYVPRLSYEFARVVQEWIEREGKPDCIESQEYLAIPYYIIQYKWLGYAAFKNIPILLTLHSPAFLYLFYNREGIYEFPNYWTGEMEIACIQGADHIIAPSAYVVEEIKQHAAIDASKVTVVRNPHNATYPGNAVPPRVERNKIVFYGKLSPQKGAFELFSYFKELWDHGFPHALIVIGGTDKVYYPEMKTMGQIIDERYKSYIEKGLIRFMGKVPPHKRDEYLSNAHVVLTPSTGDNLPYAAIEAMAIGKVVLASRQGGQREIIEHGGNGFLFDHARPGDFGEQLKQVLALGDAALRGVGEQAMQSMKDILNYETVYAQKWAIIEALSKTSPTSRSFPFTRAIDPPATLLMPGGEEGLLSVVIPYFNMGRYIDECVNSVLQSTYTDIEVLIVDDGSTEAGSLAALKQWASHPQVRVVHKKNEGLALTRNYGASLANGEFLAFLDADDLVHKTYYSQAIAVLRQYHNVYFVGAWVQFFGAKKGIWPTWNPEPPYILLHNSVNSSGLVYKKAAYLAGGKNDRGVDYGLEDYGSVISMLAHGYRGVVLPECLFFYRVRPGSMYRSLTRHKVLHSYQYISSRHSDLYSRFAPEIFNLLNANGPSFAYDNPSFGRRVTSSTAVPHPWVDRAKGFVKRSPALKKLLLQIKAFIRI